MRTKVLFAAGLLLATGVVGAVVVMSDESSCEPATPIADLQSELEGQNSATPESGEARGEIVDIDRQQSTFVIDDGTGRAIVYPPAPFESDVADLREGDCVAVSGRLVDLGGDGWDISISQAQWEVE
jgi:hypothetical protein